MTGRLSFWLALTVAVVGFGAVAESRVRHISSQSPTTVPDAGVAILSVKRDIQGNGAVALLTFPFGIEPCWFFLRQGEARSVVITDGAVRNETLSINLPFPRSEAPLEVVAPEGEQIASLPFGSDQTQLDSNRGTVRFLVARRDADGLFVELVVPNGLPRGDWLAVRQGRGWFVFATDGVGKQTILKAKIPFPPSTQEVEAVDSHSRTLAAVPAPK